MDPRRWAKVKDIFCEAAELPFSERDAYIRDATGGDEALGQDVKRLLERHEESDSIGMFEADTAHTLEPDEVVCDRFQILRFIGQGGMGEVYAAQDRELGSTVALKTLRPWLLEDREFLGRFRREIQIARQVTHPNICRVFDAGRDRQPGIRDLVFFTMELLEGKTLSEYVWSSGELSPAGAVDIIRQMAEGLRALHEQGIVHRDFKPGNVLVVAGKAGHARVVIGDFGLARALEADGARLSRTGQILGTPDYIAPEQLVGEQSTPASDIYSLGLVMHEMLTGKKVFPAGRAFEMAKTGPVGIPTEVQQRSEKVPRPLYRLILQCLEPEPARRPAAGEVAERLSDEHFLRTRWPFSWSPW